MRAFPCADRFPILGTSASRRYLQLVSSTELDVYIWVPSVLFPVKEVTIDM